SPSSGSVSSRKSSSLRRQTTSGAITRAFAVSSNAGHASPTCNASTSFETIRCRYSAAPGPATRTNERSRTATSTTTSVGIRAPHARARLARAAARALEVLLEERQVAPRPRALPGRPARLLGAVRLPQRRRLLAGAALRVLKPEEYVQKLSEIRPKGFANGYR